MSTFFTADTHFGSQRTLELSRRPFGSVKNMDQILISNWNNTVSSNDIIFHLGDVGDFDVLPKLNGQKYLLFGNYERDEFPIKDINDRESIRKLFSDKYNTQVYFDDIDISKVINLINLSNENMCVQLTHEPLIFSEPIRKTNICNLFGHIHKLCMIKAYGLNVGVDCHNFKPISLEDVEFYINAILNHYDQNVFY